MIYGGKKTVVLGTSIDATAEVSDHVTVEIQKNVANSDQRTVYIHINGVTVVRIGHILHSNLEVIFQEGLKR